MHKNNYYPLRSNVGGYGHKTHYTHSDDNDITVPDGTCDFQTYRLLRKLLVTPSYVAHVPYENFICEKNSVLVCCWISKPTNSGVEETVGYFHQRISTSLTLRRLMSYIYGAPILDVSRSHTTTQHSR